MVREGREVCIKIPYFYTTQVEPQANASQYICVLGGDLLLGPYPKRKNSSSKSVARMSR